MIKHTDLESICTLTALGMKEIGKKINSMVKERRRGQMVHVMKANMQKVKNMVKANSSGQMAPHMKACSKIIIFMDMVFTFGQTIGDTKENG